MSEWSHNGLDKSCDQVGSNIVKRSRPSSPMVITASQGLRSRKSEGNRQQLNQVNKPDNSNNSVKLKIIFFRIFENHLYSLSVDSNFF